MKSPKANPARYKATIVTAAMPPLESMEQKCELLIRDFFKNGIDSVHDMRVLNTDSKSHSAKTPEKCLQEAERAKKQMYLEACFQQR